MITAAAVAIAVLALAVVVTPFVTQAMARSSTERQIEALAFARRPGGGAA